MAKQPIKIKKSEDNPESAELLAKSIIQVAEGFEKILNTPLKQRAIVVLLREGIGESKISKKQISLVLDNLPRLKGWYLK